MKKTKKLILTSFDINVIFFDVTFLVNYILSSHDFIFMYYPRYFIFYDFKKKILSIIENNINEKL